MEHNRKQKLLMILALVLGITSLSIGFAAFSTTLNISSSASVSPNSDTFSVKFSTSQNSLVVGAVTPSSKTSGIIATNGVINNSFNPMISNLSAQFNAPGQYVEYTFYARNEGEYTAYLNNINFIGEKTCESDGDASDSLVQSACEDINISATIGNETYTETTPIEGHTLNKKTGEQIKVRLEYASNGAYVDGTFAIKFPDLALVYSTLDDSTIIPTLPEKIVRLVNGDLDTVGSEICIGEECFYLISSNADSVTMLAKYNLHIGNSVDKTGHVTPLDNPTGIQDKTARGYFSDELLYVGTTCFLESYSASQEIMTYEGSTVEDYVNNYESYLEGTGIDIEEARLITMEELGDIGLEVDSLSNSIYNWSYSTSYWTGVIDCDYGTNYCEINVVETNGDFWVADPTKDDQYGVRPVIVISKSEF